MAPTLRTTPPDREVVFDHVRLDLLDVDHWKVADSQVDLHLVFVLVVKGQSEGSQDVFRVGLKSLHNLFKDVLFLSLRLQCQYLGIVQGHLLSKREGLRYKYGVEEGMLLVDVQCDDHLVQGVAVVNDGGLGLGEVVVPVSKEELPLGGGVGFGFGGGRERGRTRTRRRRGD